MSNSLGDFLRARRAAVRPADVGLRVTGQRRVAGLRREEVAMLAGISTEYYLRLEQGRDRTPSAHVLDALARVLDLDPAQTSYMHRLAHPSPRRARTPRADRVGEGTLLLLRSLPAPAFVQNRHTDVLAANALAEALSPNMAAGANRLRAAFLDPADRELHDDWEEAAAAAVGQLRGAAGADPDDRRLTTLVGELSLKSEDFRRMWARHDVVRRSSGPVRMHHPRVGELELLRDKLLVAEPGDQMLVVYQALPGSPSADALTLLAGLAAATGEPPEADAAPSHEGPQPGRRRT
ncbi:helix-turn-helix transcriptional regulator [Streptomyces sp. NPDC047002]|uniref:helix-turn-helix domain-containing protein n=1 Tax=Streptomyces sp. NPDC047002 TaxID=3155475 RepID=UPI003455A954